MVLHPGELAEEFGDVITPEHIGIALLKRRAVPIGIRQKALTRMISPGKITAPIGAEAATRHVERLQPGHQAAGERVESHQD